MRGVAEAILDVIVRNGMIRVAHPDPDASHVFVWAANMDEQLEAAIEHFYSSQKGGEKEMSDPKAVKVGDPVIYVDPVGKERPALVTAVWSYPPLIPSLNVIFVTDNGAETDQYGLQTKHATSICHQSIQSARGNYWK